jgi:hypothetical protein
MRRGLRQCLCVLSFALAILGVLGVSRSDAQFQMPDPKQMSGIPRPVTDLPDGSISVRVIRGSLSNNISGQQVDLIVGGAKRSARTDDGGRAQFDKLPAGAQVKASADVDGEHLESQEFPAPGQGGIRLMLVATDTNAAPATSPEAPAISGAVVITDQSRIVMEPRDEVVNVFYLLDINNSARAPVNPPSAFAFDLPDDAQGAGVMEGSTPKAKVAGKHVIVEGPFPPGHTFVQVGASIPVDSGGSINISQTFPATVESVAVIAQKVGDAKLTSAQLTNQRDMPADGQTFIAATGGMLAAGRPLVLTLSGLPHHSGVPRLIALTLAGGIIAAGFLFAGSTTQIAATRAAERKRLVSRREKLLNDLARLEHDHRSGKADDARYAERRAELMSALEQVYGALDDSDVLEQAIPA